jgi:hypothetical protein
VNGVTKIYSGDLWITATGTKYANALQNDAEITLQNLDKTTQDYLLTETSPYNLNVTPKTVSLFAGRQSYGTTLIYLGTVVASRCTQPPDIGIVLKCLTGNFAKTSLITRNQPGGATIKQITQGIANDLGLQLRFQATDKTVTNFAFAGSSLNQIDAAGQLGMFNIYVDNNQLIVKNSGDPLLGSTRIVSAANGMIGIPEFTEFGIRVKFLVDNITTVGTGIQIQSDVYPAANGIYVIYKLGFQIASRETPFYYIAEAARIQ